MKKITCCIIDDEQAAIDVLSHHINKHANLDLVYATTLANNGLEWLMQNEVDIVFLDINMPEISGLDILDVLKNKFNFILTTASQEHAVVGFDKNIVDYLLKPISFSRFCNAIDKVIEKKAFAKTVEKVHYKFFKADAKGKLIKIVFDEIELIESKKNYADIQCGGKSNMIIFSLKELENILPADDFIRVHNSYIVPVKNIKRIENGEVHLHKANQTIIPIGGSLKDAALAKLGIKK